MKILLSELKELLDMSFADFKKSFRNIRSAERNFQLIVELASDINAHLIAEAGAETPDTYKESFKMVVSTHSVNKYIHFVEITASQLLDFKCINNAL